MFWWINWMGWPCVNISTCMGASGLKSHIFSSCKHTSKASWDVNVNFLSSSHKANVNARSNCLQKCIVLCFPGFRTFQVGAKRVQVWVQCFHLELTDDCVSLFGLDFDIQCACTLVWARCGRTVRVHFAAVDGVCVVPLGRLGQKDPVQGQSGYTERSRFERKRRMWFDDKP